MAQKAIDISAVGILWFFLGNLGPLASNPTLSATHFASLRSSSGAAQQADFH